MLAVSLNVEASEGDSVLVNSGLATADQLSDYLSQLRKPHSQVDSRRLLRMQRWECLDVVQSMIRSETDESVNEDGTYLFHILSVDFGEQGANRIHQLLVETGIDWNAVFQEINRYYDQAGKALAADCFEHQHQQLEALREKLDKHTDEIVSPLVLPLATVMTQQERGKRIGTLLADGGFPLGVLFEIDVESRTRSELSLLGIAIAAHQKSTGRFPASLDALVPKYLPELPTDPYTGKPFVYLVEDEGAVVYSLGKNLNDDGGTTFEDDDENFDLVFSVQRFELK